MMKYPERVMERPLDDFELEFQDKFCEDDERSYWEKIYDDLDKEFQEKVNLKH